MCMGTSCSTGSYAPTGKISLSDQKRDSGTLTGGIVQRLVCISKSVGTDRIRFKYIWGAILALAIKNQLERLVHVKTKSNYDFDPHLYLLVSKSFVFATLRLQEHRHVSCARLVHTAVIQVC